METPLSVEVAAFVRPGCFLLILAAIGWWEYRAPRRCEPMVRRVRWPGNFALLALDVLLLRLLFPLGAAGFAALWPWGLLHMVPLPGWLAGLLAVVLLDLVIYWQHRLFHRLPLLWRLHRVHHTDPRLDVSSALRFHPLEILLSMAIKVAAIALIGAGATAVLCFEVLLNGMAMFNHGNIALPGRIERSLRRWLVTPDMHRIHHSVVAGEYNSNFGFNLSCWDRLFGSYRAAPRGGQRGMTIGLQQWRDPAACGRLGWMLRAPWMAAS